MSETLSSHFVSQNSLLWWCVAAIMWWTWRTAASFQKCIFLQSDSVECKHPAASTRMKVLYYWWILRHSSAFTGQLIRVNITAPLETSLSHCALCNFESGSVPFRGRIKYVAEMQTLNKALSKVLNFFTNIILLIGNTQCTTLALIHDGIATPRIMEEVYFCLKVWLSKLEHCLQIKGGHLSSIHFISLNQGPMQRCSFCHVLQLWWVCSSVQ